MRFFDAHCDAVMHIEDGDFDFVAGKGRSHMDLPRLLAAGHGAQVFAIFAAASYYPGRDLRAFAERAIAAIHGWADASDGRLQVVRSAEEVRRSGGGEEQRSRGAEEHGEARLGPQAPPPLLPFSPPPPSSPSSASRALIRWKDRRRTCVISTTWACGW